MKPLSIYKPVTIEQAIQILSLHGSEAAVYPGGTDLLIRLKNRLQQAPTYLVDIKKIPERASARRAADRRGTGGGAPQCRAAQVQRREDRHGEGAARLGHRKALGVTRGGMEMTCLFLGRIGAPIVAAVLLAQAPAAAQQAAAGPTKPASAPTTTNWTPPRTAWGHPDLQGVYTFSTLTPLERPTTVAGKAAYTEAELAELEEQTARRREARDTAAVDPNRPPGGYNAFWTAGEQGRLTGRTSLIVDPPDGRRPPLTPRAQKIRDERIAAAEARRIGDTTLYNTWEDHPMYTRCVARPMPRIGQAYNHGVMILQTPTSVAIFYESMHDVRIIPLDGRPHLHSSIRQWNGDARGRWEGNTLVVDWTNFTDKQEFAGVPQGNMRFTERFTKVDANTINYAVTVTDPTTWTAPWTFVQPWRSDDPNYQKAEDLYEYACHEGNYRMMENSLKGSRLLKQTRGGK